MESNDHLGFFLIKILHYYSFVLDDTHISRMLSDSSLTNMMHSRATLDEAIVRGVCVYWKIRALPISGWWW